MLLRILYSCCSCSSWNFVEMAVAENICTCTLAHECTIWLYLVEYDETATVGGSSVRRWRFLCGPWVSLLLVWLESPWGNPTHVLSSGFTRTVTFGLMSLILTWNTENGGLSVLVPLKGHLRMAALVLWARQRPQLCTSRVLQPGHTCSWHFFYCGRRFLRLWLKAAAFRFEVWISSLAKT